MLESDFLSKSVAQVSKKKREENECEEQTKDRPYPSGNINQDEMYINFVYQLSIENLNKHRNSFYKDY